MKTVLLHDRPLSDNGNHRPRRAKRFGRGRIAGLILIALVTLGLGYLHFAGGSASGLRAFRRARRPADAEALHLRERAGRLRHARRPREPARPALAPDRAAGHAHPRALGPSRARRSSGSRAAPASRTWTSPTRAASPPATTSCSSATAASTDRRASTAPRSIASREHSRDLLGTASLRADAAAYRACANRLAGQRRRPRRLLAARAGRRPRARAHATSATDRSTSSARAPARARR